jgi:hypothetical protein
VTDGALFLFVNRKRDRIKALWWETGGLTLWYRRLEQGTVELSTYLVRSAIQGCMLVRCEVLGARCWVK